MRLLVTTQAVDKDDPILGFFHRWLLEFARQFDEVQVICLREGAHDLPANVHVRCLGKTSMELATRTQKIAYARRFYGMLWDLRGSYDAVFCHMNPEYMALAGWYWRLAHIPAVLFYTHKHVGLVLRIAHLWAQNVISASPGSFRIASRKVLPLGHGIDTDFFVPTVAEVPAHDELRVVYAGRMAPAKHTHELFLGFAAAHEAQLSVHLDHYGDSIPRDAEYAKRAHEIAEPLVKAGVVTLHGGVDQPAMMRGFQAADCFINTTPAGSFDKAVLEGMAAGIPGIVCNSGFFDAVPAGLRFDLEDTASMVAALSYCTRLTPAERKAVGADMRGWVVEHHSLARLVTKLKTVLS
jgi:glycosyltransferase involved in cell wall biosynthesis